MNGFKGLEEISLSLGGWRNGKDEQSNLAITPPSKPRDIYRVLKTLGQYIIIL